MARVPHILAEFEEFWTTSFNQLDDILAGMKLANQEEDPRE